MKQMTVGDFKAQFSSVLDQVMQGEEIQILYGRAKKPVARLTKFTESNKRKRRPLGMYNETASYWEDENFEITPEILFNDMNDLK